MRNKSTQRGGGGISGCTARFGPEEGGTGGSWTQAASKLCKIGQRSRLSDTWLASSSLTFNPEKESLLFISSFFTSTSDFTKPHGAFWTGFPSSSLPLLLSPHSATPPNTHIPFIAPLSTTLKLQPSQTFDKYSSLRSTLARCLLCHYANLELVKDARGRMCLCVSSCLWQSSFIKCRSISPQGHFKFNYEESEHPMICRQSWWGARLNTTRS